MMQRLKNSQSGLTLIELMVAVSLFTVVILTSSTIFLRSIENQSKTIAVKGLQEGMNYAMGIMLTEAEGAQSGGPSTCGCSEDAGDVFYCTDVANELTFENSDNDCVTYEIYNDVKGRNRLKITRAGDEAYLTPDTFNITAVNFNTVQVNDGTYPAGKITIFIQGKSLNANTETETINLEGTAAVWPGN